MDKSELQTLAYRPEWTNKLKIENANAEDDVRWELHPTGDADLKGRTYVALPVGTKLTENVKRYYNLM